MEHSVDVAVGQDEATGEIFVLLQIGFATKADFRIKLTPKDATSVGKLLTTAGFKATLKSPRLVVPASGE